jgi:hypothetical protein
MHGGWSEAASVLSPPLSAQGLRSRAGDGPPVSGAACCPADKPATLQLGQLVQDRPAFPRSEACADQQVELPGIAQARPVANQGEQGEEPGIQGAGPAIPDTARPRVAPLFDALGQRTIWVDAALSHHGGTRTGQAGRREGV